MLTGACASIELPSGNKSLRPNPIVWWSHSTGLRVGKVWRTYYGVICADKYNFGGAWLARFIVVAVCRLQVLGQRHVVLLPFHRKIKTLYSKYHYPNVAHSLTAQFCISPVFPETRHRPILGFDDLTALEHVHEAYSWVVAGVKQRTV
jgi:hypothetical protein